MSENIVKYTKNPFIRFGALKTGAKSYITRGCDTQVKEALENDKCIAVWGNWQLGKSSLLYRIPAMIENKNSNWKFTFIDFQGLLVRGSDNFSTEIYSELGEEWGVSPNLESFGVYLNSHPAIICFDEFERLNPSTARDLLPNLQRLLGNNPENLKIVVAMRKSITSFLTDPGIGDPSFLQDWSEVELFPFDKEQVISLLALLPPSVQEVTQNNLQTIFEFSGKYPKKLQCLCHYLWEANNEEDCLAIINDVDKYK